jgi:secreted trypsin-like serine protease
MLNIKRVIAAAAALATAASVALPAAAITGGQPDGTAHPNVGLVLFYAADGDTNARFRCSGTLVAPDVILTAAHCTADTAGLAVITFTSKIALEPPSNLPRATDDTGDGTSDSGYTSIPTGFYGGQAIAHPQYSNFADRQNWNDVGVILLQKPVPKEVATPAKIAPARYLDAYAPPKLNKTNFTLVGYGTEVRKPDSGPQKPTPMSYPLIRRNTTSNGQKLTEQIVQMNGNPANVLAGGGTCFGDSGGPSFLNGYLTTVTSYGLTQNCRYIGGYQRVDIPVVQNWLKEFGVTP